MPDDNKPTTQSRSSEEKPWRMSWVLIAILIYALIQMTYFVFFAKG